MNTVKELIEELQKFPEDSEVLITWIGHAQSYYKLKDLGNMKVQDPDNNTESKCPVLVF